MRLMLLALLTVMAPPAVSQDATALQDSDFVSVRIDGSLNLRAGPTTDAERLLRLEDGTILRRIGCQPGADEAWCEVETLDGAIEGWASARFLRPWRGADPAALDSPVITFDDRLSAEAPGRFAGKIEPGQIFDIVLKVPTESEARIALEAPSGVGMAVFASDGSVIETGRGSSEFAVVLLVGGEILVRLADMAGARADWSLDVALD